MSAWIYLGRIISPCMTSSTSIVDEGGPARRGSDGNDGQDAASIRSDLRDLGPATCGTREGSPHGSAPW